MAWIRWRGRGESKKAHIGYRDPVTREEVYPVEYRTGDRVLAEKLRVEAEAKFEHKRVRKTRSAVAVAFADWGRWLLEKGRSEDTWAYYKGKIGALVKELGTLGVERLRASHVEEYAARPRGVTGRTRTNGTRRGIIQAYGAFLAWCVDRRLPVSPAVLASVEAIERPPVERHDRIALTPAQLGAIVSAADGTPIYVAVALAAFGGFPRGDIRTLRREELDLSNGVIVRRRGRRKTSKMYRTEISPSLVVILKAAPVKGELVAPLGKGGYASRLLRAAYAKAGVPRERGDLWHRLRHGFLTGLSAAGADVATIAAAAGHAQGSRQTLEYIHATAERMRAAVDAFDRKARPTFPS